MSKYRVRKGIDKRSNPASTWNELFSMKGQMCDDDGLVVRLGEEPWPDKVQCPDCKKADVMWAEAGYCSGHRICPLCGSHWTLYDNKGYWFLRRARFRT